MKSPQWCCHCCAGVQVDGAAACAILGCLAMAMVIVVMMTIDTDYDDDNDDDGDDDDDGCDVDGDVVQLLCRYIYRERER